jgi:uncharacterized membrane protein
MVALFFTVAGVAGVVYQPPKGAGAFGGFLALLSIFGLFGYAGAANIWRWKYRRGFAKTLSWVTLVVIVIAGIVRVIDRGPQELLPLQFVFAIFYFVLWALHREQHPARA